MTRSQNKLLAPESETAPIDWAQLDRATLGDAGLARDVLRLFGAQAGTIAEAIRELPPDAGLLAHKLKGSAQGIGAWAVAAAAETLEAALAGLSDPRPEVLALLSHIASARKAIAAHVDRA